MKYAELTRKVIGCAMEVHRIMGSGFQERLYHQALAHELSLQKVKFASEVDMNVYYKDLYLGTRRVDFLVDDVISVEIKAVNQLDDKHLNQAINYLEAYNLEIGLLINFGALSLEFKRVHNKKHIP